MIVKGVKDRNGKWLELSFDDDKVDPQDIRVIMFFEIQKQIDELEKRIGSLMFKQQKLVNNILTISLVGERMVKKRRIRTLILSILGMIAMIVLLTFMLPALANSFTITIKNPYCFFILANCFFSGIIFYGCLDVFLEWLRNK